MWGEPRKEMDVSASKEHQKQGTDQVLLKSSLRTEESVLIVKSGWRLQLNI